MPPMDGVETSSYIRSIEKEQNSEPCKIALVTAEIKENITVDKFYYNCLIDDMIFKPFKSIDIRCYLSKNKVIK